MKLRLAGIVALIVGVFFLFSSFSITGSVVLDEIGGNAKSIVGIVLIVIGIALIYIRR